MIKKNDVKKDEKEGTDKKKELACSPWVFQRWAFSKMGSFVADHFGYLYLGIFRIDSGNEKQIKPEY